MKTQLIAFFVLAGTYTSAQEVFISPKISEQWATPEGLKIPESVLYDPSANVFYVSNMGNYPDEQGKAGFISRISEGGEILDIKWIDGLDSPTGMGLVDDRLYVAEIDQVTEIDKTQGAVIKTYRVNGARFLNDIATGADGKVFISDSDDSAVYLLDNGSIKLFLKSDKLSGINGLWVHGNNLLAGLSDKIVSISLSDKSVTNYILNTGDIDGIVPDGRGNYLISSWIGRIHLVGQSTEKEMLLDTTPEKINSADIEFIIDKRLLLVPTFYDSRVVCYKLAE